MCLHPMEARAALLFPRVRGDPSDTQSCGQQVHCDLCASPRPFLSPLHLKSVAARSRLAPRAASQQPLSKALPRVFLSPGHLTAPQVTPSPEAAATPVLQPPHSHGRPLRAPLPAEPVTLRDGESPAVPVQRAGLGSVRCPRRAQPQDQSSVLGGKIWQQPCLTCTRRLSAAPAPWEAERAREQLFLVYLVLAMSSLKDTEGTNVITWSPRARQDSQPPALQTGRNTPANTSPGENL